MRGGLSSWDRREERGYIDHNPGPHRPTSSTEVLWHTLTRWDPRTPCGADVGGRKCGGDAPARLLSGRTGCGEVDFELLQGRGTCVSPLARLSLIGRRYFNSPWPKLARSEVTKYVLPLVHQHPVAWPFWQSGPDSSTGSVILHLGLVSCIIMADLLPLAAMHQAIKTTVYGTVPVSNCLTRPAQEAMENSISST